MKMYRRILEALAIIAALSGGVLWCQSQPLPPHEQRLFDVEEVIAHKGQFRSRF